MDYLLLCGAPHLIVNLKPVMLAGVDVMCRDGCIKAKNDEFMPYKLASTIPDQAGQLVAGTYEFIVATCLQKLMNRQECKAVAGCGLHIIRSHDVYNFMVNLNKTGMAIRTKCYISSHNKISVVAHRDPWAIP